MLFFFFERFNCLSALFTSEKAFLPESMLWVVLLINFPPVVIACARVCPSEKLAVLSCICPRLPAVGPDISEEPSCSVSAVPPGGLRLTYQRAQPHLSLEGEE